MIYDIIIIGAGPAGMTAAIYAMRAGRTALIIEKGSVGGQIALTHRIDNYPGLPGVTGSEFAERLMSQVTACGCETVLDEVKLIERHDSLFTVKTTLGAEFEGRAVIAATGASPRRLGLGNEERLIGNGVSFCAVCDGQLFRGKTVAVNGGGNTALQDALYLSELCDTVYLIHRRDAFRADKNLVSAVRGKKNIILIMNSRVTGLHGENKLDAVTVSDSSDWQEKIVVDGLFEAIGQVPQSNLFADFVKLDGYGYADCDESCVTQCKGLFVAGDCRRKEVRQLTTAVSDGTAAAIAAGKYLDSNG